MQRLKKASLRFPFVKASHSALSAFRNEYQRIRVSKGQNLSFRVVKNDVGPGPKFPFDCYLTTDCGLFRLCQGRFQRLTLIGGYGFALSGEHAFLSLNFYGRSSLVSLELEELQKPRQKVYAMEHWGVPITDNAERFHQVTSRRDGPIWVANTSRNTLLRIDPHNHDRISEYSIFHDQFGVPILYDHNHINSVVQYEDVILFSAYRAGENSLICVINGDRIKGYAYPRKGVHDIYLTSTGFLLCDTFGENQPGRGGAPYTENGIIDPKFFGREPGYVVRGAVGLGEDWLIGYSHKGERKKRYEGNGGVIVISRGKVQETWTLPAAQIYQIVREDKEFIDPVQECSVEQVCSLFEEVLGPPVYEGQIREVR